jgi:Protein of unknown function (DUF2851)
MKEDFLHYVWKYKKFEFTNLKTTSGNTIVINNSGQHNRLSGPDFFNAQITIDDQKWAGNVEIHIKASDWYVHHHEKDLAYENVILHVVWEHNTEIYRKDNSLIPVLELKNYVNKTTLDNYNNLMLPKNWIFCENQIKNTDSFVLKNWQERLFFERLERKSKPIFELLQQTKNDWEAVLFSLLAKNFGLNINGEAFFQTAQSIPFSIIRKESFEVQNLEALLFGHANLLVSAREDNYFKDLKIRYYYLIQKYKLEAKSTIQIQFFKLRPDNFPTIRLSQLANLYHKEQQLFSKIIEANSIEKIATIFKISTSNYWQNHYQFDKESPVKNKKLSKSFVNLLLINTIIPLQFAYAKSQDKDITENLIDLLHEIAPEENEIIKKFNACGIKAKNAFETQSLLQLKNEYCNKKECLSCAIGLELIKSNT